MNVRFGFFNELDCSNLIIILDQNWYHENRNDIKNWCIEHRDQGVTFFNDLLLVPEECQPLFLLRFG